MTIAAQKIFDEIKLKTIVIIVFIDLILKLFES